MSRAGDKRRVLNKDKKDVSVKFIKDHKGEGAERELIKNEIFRQFRIYTKFHLSFTLPIQVEKSDNGLFLLRHKGIRR